MLISREHPAKLRFFSFLIFFLLILRCAACPAQERPIVTFAASNWVPFTYEDERGDAQGLYIDILKEIFVKQLGFDLTFQIFPWKRAQYNLQTGLSDLLITVPTEERMQYSIPSEVAVLDLFLQVYTYNNHPKLEAIQTISSTEDFQKLQLVAVTNIGNEWHKDNIDRFTATTQYVTNEESAFQIVAAKRADITIEPIFAGSYLINKLGLNDKVVATRARFGPIKMYLLMSNQSKHVFRMDLVNSALKKLKSSERFAEILRKYE